MMSDEHPSGEGGFRDAILFAPEVTDTDRRLLERHRTLLVPMKDDPPASPKVLIERSSAPIDLSGLIFRCVAMSVAGLFLVGMFHLLVGLAGFGTAPPAGSGAVPDLAYADRLVNDLQWVTIGLCILVGLLPIPLYTFSTIKPVGRTTRRAAARAVSRHGRYLVPAEDLDPADRTLLARARRAAGQLSGAAGEIDHLLDLGAISASLPQRLWNLGSELFALSQRQRELDGAAKEMGKGYKVLLAPRRAALTHTRRALTRRVEMLENLAARVEELRRRSRAQEIAAELDRDTAISLAADRAVRDTAERTELGELADQLGPAEAVLDEEYQALLAVAQGDARILDELAE